jgi:hypothetical protein
VTAEEIAQRMDLIEAMNDRSRPRSERDEARYALTALLRGDRIDREPFDVKQAQIPAGERE